MSTSTYSILCSKPTVLLTALLWWSPSESSCCHCNPVGSILHIPIGHFSASEPLIATITLGIAVINCLQIEWFKEATIFKTQISARGIQWDSAWGWPGLEDKDGFPHLSGIMAGCIERLGSTGPTPALSFTVWSRATYVVSPAPSTWLLRIPRDWNEGWQFSQGLVPDPDHQHFFHTLLGKAIKAQLRSKISRNITCPLNGKNNRRSVATLKPLC